MSKLTTEQRRELKEAVKETLIRKLSQKESHDYVNSKLGFNISFSYVQSLRSEISKSAKSELLTLQKDHYALIQSLFFDRRDELEYMQKVLWGIIEKNQLNPEIQLKAIDKLSELTTILTELYHSLPSKVSFGLERRAYIDRYNIKDIKHYNLDSKELMTRDELLELDHQLDLQTQLAANAECDREFEELKKKNPTWTKQRIYDEMDYQALHRSSPKDFPEPTLLENNPDFYNDKEDTAEKK